MRKTLKVILISLIVVLAITACNLPGAKNNGGSNAATPDLVNTAAAQTIEAVKTGLAIEATEPAQPTLAPTWTVMGTDGDEAGEATAEAVEPTSEPLPTSTPLPTWTPYPTPTNTPEPVCNAMQFLRDVTIPDGTWMQPNQEFTKIWEVKNIGACTWDAGYSIVFANEGNSMGGAASVGISDAPVKPGETMLIAMNFEAPNTDNIYTGAWRLRSTSGQEFGRFTVKIDVDGNPDEFIFTKYLCSAEYSNSAGILPCPMEKKTTVGYAYVDEAPAYENDYQDDEDALIMIPRDVENGQLFAEFFQIRMPGSTAHFRTLAGCVKGKTNCDTIMRIYYQADGDASRTMIAEWDEKYDGNLKNIDIDLAPYNLEGKLVSFTFEVHADGQPKDDEVFWLLPRIIVP